MPAHATALFADRHAAHAAVEQLVQAGFPRDAISVVMSQDTHEREFAPASEPGARVTGANGRHAGVLAAIVAGVVVLSRADGLALRAAGPLLRWLVPAGDEALSAAFTGAGLEAHEARFVDQGVRAGSILVGVQGEPDRVRLALKLLALSGGDALRAA